MCLFFLVAPRDPYVHLRKQEHAQDDTHDQNNCKCHDVCPSLPLGLRCVDQHLGQDYGNANHENSAHAQEKQEPFCGLSRYEVVEVQEDVE